MNGARGRYAGWRVRRLTLPRLHSLEEIDVAPAAAAQGCGLGGSLLLPWPLGAAAAGALQQLCAALLPARLQHRAALRGVCGSGCLLVLAHPLSLVPSVDLRERRSERGGGARESAGLRRGR